MGKPLFFANHDGFLLFVFAVADAFIGTAAAAAGAAALAGFFCFDSGDDDSDHCHSDQYQYDDGGDVHGITS